MQESELLTPDTVFTILDGVSEGVLIVEQTGSILFMNQAARSNLRPFEPLTYTDLTPLLTNALPLDKLLAKPCELTAVTPTNALQLTCKPIKFEHAPHVQINIALAPAKVETPFIDQLGTLLQIDQEADFAQKMSAVIQGAQQMGWNYVSLNLRSESLIPIESSIPSRQEQGDSILSGLPNSFWSTLTNDEALAQYQTNSCYFIPVEATWLTRQWRKHNIQPANEQSLTAAQWHSGDLVCVPLYGREQRQIGQLVLDKPEDGRRPTSAKIEMIALYGRFAASLLENSLLFEESLSRTRELEILFNTSQALSSTLDRHEVLTILGQYMLQSVDADGYTIYRWSRRRRRLLVLQEFAASAIGGQTVRSNTAVSLPPLTNIDELLNQKYANVHDLATFNALPNPTWLTEPEQFSCALLPLVRSDETYGLIQIFKRKNGRSFSDRDLKLLFAIGNQASTALETALIFEDTYEREQFYNSLGNVNLAMNFNLDRELVLRLICEEARRIFNVDGAYLWQVKEQQFIGTAADGYAAEQFLEKTISLNEPNSFAHHLLQQGETQFINNTQAEELTVALPDPDGIQAILGVPLEQKGFTIGLLMLTDRQNPMRFDNRDASWASLYGVQVSIALQNASLLAELRDFNEQLDSRVATRTQELNQQNERVQILLRITSELSRSLDQDRVITKALALVNDVVQASQGIIMLIDQTTGELMFRASVGGDAPPTYNQVTPSGLMRDQGLAGWIIDHRAPVIVHDTKQDPRWVSLPSSDKYNSVLGIPLISNDDVIGVMMLFHTETSAFTAQQLDLVEAATIQVANAINNASLYRLISEQAERLGAALRSEIIQKANLEAVLESMADGVLVADEQNNIDTANLSASAILDIPRDQLLGHSINELLGLYGNFEKPWLTTIDEWAKNSDRITAGTFLTDQLQIEDKFISVKLSPVISDKLFYGTVSIFRDITKEVEVERLKNEFVSTVSHELRTPMTSIKGYADLLLMGAAGEMTEPQLQYLSVIKSNAERLHLLVNDLLDISRIETGKTELDLRPLNIPQLIDEVVQHHLNGRIHEEGKTIQLETAYEPTLPLVNGDRHRIIQVLTNLLDNAFNYTEQPGKIKLNAHSNGEFVYVSVADNGIGISEENLTKIFDRFYRSENEKVQRVSGTGLGLAIVQSLVQMHGGQLFVDSELGKGSKFTFNLPVVVEDGDPTAAVR